MNLILDVQGFKIENNKFITKELAGYNGEKICHYVFKPPFSMELLPPNLQRQANWLMNNFHCINWNQGFTPLFQFGSIIKSLTSSADIIYIKGKEKAEYIKQFTSKPVVEFEDTPALQFSEPKCFYHKKSPCMCALSNVYFLYNNFMM